MKFKEFYTCPSCGRAISGEKKEFLYARTAEGHCARKKI